MDWTRIDWQALDRLRTAFIAGSAGTQEYWHSESDLSSYDQTFAQRIGWKWSFVLQEVQRRNWAPPPGPLLDWGCGSGIAGRVFLEHFRGANVSPLQLWDRSAHALRYAGRRATEAFPSVMVEIASGSSPPPGTLLLSHVLTELNEQQLDSVLELAARATAVLWVEPGTFETSRALIRIRERLRDRFHVVAPCPHASSCGLLSSENARHWCHHFAPPPPEIFTDGSWARFGKLMGIDLRSLPLSFLVLDRRSKPPWTPGTVRVIGKPRVYKAHALLLGCDASGVHERRLSKRVLPEEFRALKKEAFDPVQVMRCEGGEIMASKPPE